MRAAVLALFLLSSAHAQDLNGPGIPPFINDDFPCTAAFAASSALSSQRHVHALVQEYDREDKSMREFREYMKLYVCNPERLDNFTNVFEERLKASTAFFHLPRAMVGCLVLRESWQWQLFPKSKTGVQGPIQATKQMVDQINTILHDHQHHEDIYESWQHYFLGVQDITGSALVDPTQWPDFIPDGADRDAEKTYRDVQISFGLNGAYLRYLQKQLDKVLLDHPKFKISMMNYSLLLVAMYNTGEGDVLKVVKKFMNKHPQGVAGSRWVDELGKMGLRGEGVEHIKAIRNCMQKGKYGAYG